MPSKAPALRLAFAALVLLSLATCKKENDPCYPRTFLTLYYNSWPIILPHDSTWSVSRSHIPISLYLEGDSNGEEEVLVSKVEIRIRANATDSLLYSVDLYPDTYQVYCNETAVLDSITVAIPATVKVVVTNSCGISSEVQRNLLITPD